MLIMSQEKSIILFTENIQGIIIDDNQTNKRIYGITEGDDSIILGEYSTSKRAYEVFYDILIAYSEGASTFLMAKE